ncbi:MAG: hypothetical protein GF403_01920 [Candidatus Coatesbacteria bacterium]|nr:hypothetical protein [Candidatus Coatesbacteria bacterium]
MKHLPLILLLTFTLAAFVGCDSGTGSDDDGGGGSNKTLSWALAKADPLADGWDAENKLVGVVGLWVDTDGELDEQPDNPAWGALYTNQAEDAAYGVLVHYDGTTESDLEQETPDMTEEITPPDDDKVDSLIDAAVTTMEDHPAPLNAYDYAFMVGYDDDLLDRVVVLVNFYAEADQDTQYEEDIFVLPDPYAFVILDQETEIVLFKSW